MGLISTAPRLTFNDRRLLRAYLDIVRGVDKRFPEWLTPTYRTAERLEVAAAFALAHDV